MILKGKVALVTGGSRGIGRAISVRLASMGAYVYINYVSRPEAAEETKRIIEDAGGRGEIIGFDIANGSQVQDSLKKIIEDAGSLDILINNAGITRDGLIARMKEEDWDAVLTTNLKGAFLCAKALVFQAMEGNLTPQPQKLALLVSLSPWQENMHHVTLPLTVLLLDIFRPI